MSRRATDSTQSLGRLLLAFVVVIVVLESGGLLTWANRLEVGPLRSVALPVAAAVHESLQPLGIERLRASALAGLDRLQNDAPPPADAAPAPETIECAQCPAEAAPAPAASTASAANPASAAALSAIVLPKQTALPALAAPPAPGQPRVVALVGDSMMAVGLSATLLRGMAGRAAIKPVRAFRSGTGLSRPEVFDWMTQYPLMLGQQQPSVIIVAIGANDGQGFVVDGKVQAFGSDAWVKTYQSRLSAFLAMLTRHDAQVLWLSLPPMRLPKYNDHMDTINRIAYQVVNRDPRASWLNTAAYVGDDAGRYREFMQGKNNRVIRLRADDGIHLSDQGAALLTDPLLAWLDPPAPPASAASAPAQAAATPGSP